MSEYKQVTKEEFYQYAANRFEATGHKLDRDVAMMCEPPLLTLNDFSGDLVWPESIVAKGVMYDGSEYHGFKQAEYYVKNEELEKYGVIS